MAPAAVLAGLLLVTGLTSCGNHTTPQGDSENAEIPFTQDELKLLEAPDTVASPSGPVSRENYRQQLDALEKEVSAEAAR